MTAPEPVPVTITEVAALAAALDRRLTSVEVDHFVVVDQLRRVQDQAGSLAKCMDEVESALADLADALPDTALVVGPEPEVVPDLPGLADALQHRQNQLDDPPDDAAPATTTPAPDSPSAVPVGSRPAGQGPAVVLPELAVLHDWVEHEVAQLVRKMTTTGEGGGVRWCRSWWEHGEAVRRLTALYLVHAELSGSGEPTWLSVYLRDHLDPHLAVLTSPIGPFYACSPRRHSTATEPLGQHEPPL